MREGREAARDAVPLHIEENSTTFLDSGGLRSIPKGPLLRAGRLTRTLAKAVFPSQKCLNAAPMAGAGGVRSFAGALAEGNVAPKTDYPDKHDQIAKIDEAVIQGRAARGLGGNCK